MDCACQNTAKWGLILSLPSVFKDDIWGSSLFVISIFSYSLLALVIHRNKSLQVHPMNLIFYITITQAILLNVVFAADKICRWNLYQTFAVTVLFNNSLPS
jgi:hypothetical protein